MRGGIWITTHSRHVNMPRSLQQLGLLSTDAPSAGRYSRALTATEVLPVGIPSHAACSRAGWPATAPASPHLPSQVRHRVLHHRVGKPQKPGQHHKEADAGEEEGGITPDAAQQHAGTCTSRPATCQITLSPSRQGSGWDTLPDLTSATRKMLCACHLSDASGISRSGSKWHPQASQRPAPQRCA